MAQTSIGITLSSLVNPAPCALICLNQRACLHVKHEGTRVFMYELLEVALFVSLCCVAALCLHGCNGKGTTVLTTSSVRAAVQEL